MPVLKWRDPWHTRHAADRRGGREAGDYCGADRLQRGSGGSEGLVLHMCARSSPVVWVACVRGAEAICDDALGVGARS
eukprot:768538-Hanusia_phi.AAC.1